MTGLVELLLEVKACQLCAPHLPFPPQPILRVQTTSRLLIVGQAPGTRVHATGIPWNDPSGDRLREWLQLDWTTFYDDRHIAIIPTGLCYPGKGKSGDLPPRPECAPHWHPRLLAYLPDIQLKLLIGHYAQLFYLGARCQTTLTATVQRWRDYLPDYLPLPHPSPRNELWFKRNPWFMSEVVPALRSRVAHILTTSPQSESIE